MYVLVVILLVRQQRLFHVVTCVSWRRDLTVHQSIFSDRVKEAASRSLPRLKMVIISSGGVTQPGRRRFALPAVCVCVWHRCFQHSRY